MTQSLLHGVVVPVITPVDDDDRIDELAFRRMIRHLIQAGVHGLFIGGSAGEGPLFVMREWTRMVEIAFDENKNVLPLLAGAIDTSTQRVKEKIKILAAIGYHYFVVTPTFYIPLKTGDEHLRLFGECAATADGMEMIAYNIPASTGSTIPIEIICEMAKQKWIKYCKESSGNLTYFHQLVSASAGLGLNVLMGDESSMAEGLSSGACGIVPVCANYEPSTFIRAYQAAVRGDGDELAKAQARIVYLKENLALAGSNWIAGLKYAMSLKGIGSGKPVSPLQPLSDSQKKNVENFHASCR